MKFTSPENITKSEKLLIDAINSELNLEAIERFLLEKHRLTLQAGIDCKDGDLVVHNDAVAYKFNFEVRVPFSVIFDRQGECLDISTLSGGFEEEDKDKEILHDSSSVTDDDIRFTADDVERAAPDEKVEQMASNIADMISEINEDDD